MQLTISSFVNGMQDVLTHLVSLAEAEDKVVRLRVCQLLQLIINNQATPSPALHAPVPCGQRSLSMSHMAYLLL